MNKKILTLLKSQWLAGMNQHFRNQIMITEQRMKANPKDFRLMASKEKLEKDLQNVQKLYNDVFDETLEMMHDDHGLIIKSFEKPKENGKG